MSTLLTLDQSGWFDRITPSGIKLGVSYQEDGFVIRESFGDAYGLLYKIEDPSAAIPLSSGPYLLAAIPDVARADGGRFGLSQLDVDLHGGGPVSISFTGVKADGTQVHFDAAVDGTADSFQTISLPDSFTDLVDLKFQGPSFNQISFDNLTLTQPHVVTGGPGADTLVAAAGSNDLFGYGGADLLKGGDGADWLDGGQGDDTMIGGKGDDVYFVNSHGDKVIEAAGGGVDTVRTGLTYFLPDNVENLELLYAGAASGTGNALNNHIVGNAGPNLLRGLGGDDILIGGAGADTLEGGSGRDVLAGGAGLDTLRGGAGADLFLFQHDELDNAATPLAVVVDFSSRQGDKISVGALSVFKFLGTDPFTGDPATYDDTSAGQFRYEKTSDGVVLMGDVNGDGIADWTINLTGVTSLHSSDFV